MVLISIISQYKSLKVAYWQWIRHLGEMKQVEMYFKMKFAMISNLIA